MYPSFSENKSENLRIGIVLIENPDDDAGIESLCETATDTIELTLRLVNKYTVERLDFLLPETNISRAKLYFKSNGIDNAVFGEIVRSKEGEYTFIVKGWERASDSIVVQAEERSTSVFDMFDIVDNITIEFIEDLSGEHIGFGKINFINKGVDSDYKIYVDGNYIGKNLGESDILYGERVFKITTPGQLGDTVVETVTVNVEENGEHDIVFSMGKVVSDITSLDTSKVTAIGNLFIESDPVGSEVFLDNQSVGFTPLSLYGVGSGLYDLRVGSEYYIPAFQVLRLEPNIDNTLNFDLVINADQAEIREHLKDPAKTELWAVGVTTGQLIWLLGKSLLFNNINYVDVLIMTPRYGHFLAGDVQTGVILSSISLVSLMSITGIYDPVLETNVNNSGEIYGLTMGLAIGGSLVYDLVGTLFASQRWNEKFLKKLKTEGVIFEDKKGKDLLRYTIQTGGGGIIHAGVSWTPLWDWLYFEQLAGISYNYYLDILQPVFSSTSKVLFYPLPDAMSLFNPYVGVILNIGTDFNSTNFAYGLSSGFEIRLSWFDIFMEADLYVSNKYDTLPASLALGVRL